MPSKEKPDRRAVMTDTETAKAELHEARVFGPDKASQGRTMGRKRPSTGFRTALWKAEKAVTRDIG